MTRIVACSRSPCLIVNGLMQRLLGVEMAAVSIAEALPAHEPVGAGIELEGEPFACVELPLNECGAGGAIDPNVAEGALHRNGLTHNDLSDP